MSKQEKKGLVPALRFPEFRGKGEWEKKSINQIAAIHKGKGISKADISADGKQPCIRYGELYTSYGEVIDEVISKTSLSSSDLFLSEKKDVIIPSSGETKIDIATAACVLHDNIALGGDLNVIRTNQNGVFLSYCFNGVLKNKIAKIAQGDTVVHLYATQLKQLDIAIPSGKEQQKIADCLTSVDELITFQTQKLDALKTHKKGLMQQLFPAEGETLPKLRFPEFRGKGEWEETTLGQCLVRRPEYGINAPSVPFAENLPTYLRITDISDDGRVRQDQRVSVAKNVTDENYLEDGDIVLARTGASVGKAYKYRINDGRLVFAGFLIRVRADEQKLNSEFLFHFLSTEQYWRWVDFSSARSGQPGINGNEYASLPLQLPPTLKEQQKIADCLASIGELIAVQTQKIEVFKAHKKGLMQQLFPGAGTE